MKKLYKTTAVIWTEYDPRVLELEELAAEATSGNAYCSKLIADLIDDPIRDPDWDGTEFFNLDK